MLQSLRIQLKLRLGFQDHMVLVQLRVHRIDLALSKGVIQSVVDGRGRDSQPRGRRAIDNQRDRQTARLLVGGYILKFLQAFQLCRQSGWSSH